MYESENCMLKNGNWKLILFPVLVVVLLVVIFVVVFTKGHPRTPATPAQVLNVIEENGFIGANITSDYQQKWEMGDELQNAIAFEDGDIRFDFFEFDSYKNAEHIRKQYRSYIRENRYDIPNIEVSEGAANYMLYTIKANGLYTICMRVDNTLVFAYCNEENAGKLNAIMIGIGYFDE